MPLGLNRTDLNTTGTSYKNGTPITLPHNFGNPVTTPVDFGNDVTLPVDRGNDVTWAPSPSHFGNVIGGSGPPPAGPELIANTSAATGGSFAGTITTSAVNTTGATVLFAVAARFTGGTVVVTDSKNNTWIALPIVNGGNTCPAQIFYCYQGPGASGPVVVGSGHTATAVSSGNDIALAFMAFSGVKTSADPFETYSDVAPVEGQNTVQPGSLTPVAANDLFITGWGAQAATGSLSIDSSFVYNSDDVGTTACVGSAYFVASASAENPTWTVGANNGRMNASQAVFAHA